MTAKSTIKVEGASTPLSGPVSQPAVSEASVREYFELLKPNVMYLVIFTGLVGMVVAPGTIHPIIGMTAILCISIGAGAAGALNMWYEADIDAAMQRTRSRPIPRGSIQPNEALAFGVVLSCASVLAMAVLVNYISAALLAITIAFYLFIYTIWLKRRTPQNIVIGGAAGAFPPVIGWAAVTGSADMEAWALFLIVFMWTPPHFWALSLYRAGDYAKAGVPMLPVVAGKANTRTQMLAYSIALAAVSLLPYVMGFAGLIYFAVTLLSGIGLIVHASNVWWIGRLAEQQAAAGSPLAKKNQVRADHAARRMFKYSTLYLFVIFLVLLIEEGLALDVAAWLPL